MSKGFIKVELDTVKLTKKLKAISNHIESLIKEFETIDKSNCPKCDSDNVNVSVIRSTDGLFNHFHCVSCRNTWND